MVSVFSAPLISAYGQYAAAGFVCYGLFLSITYIFKISNGKSEKDQDDVGLVFRDSDDSVKFEDDSKVEGEVWEEFKHVAFPHQRYSLEKMVKRSRDFYEDMGRRRSLRFYSEDPVPVEVIKNIIKTAGTAPSGAHTEPWSFVVISNKSMKATIREIVEEEEEINYRKRMGDKWVSDLSRIGTNWEKPYLEKAPYLVIVFKQTYGVAKDGHKITHYYNEISACISVGILLAAIQNAGLVTLTSTPMNAGPKLRTLLKRPMNEKAILLLPIGYPAEDATVPYLVRKPLENIMFTHN